MPELAVHSKQFNSANTLRIEVGTNCPRGAQGTNGRTVLRLINEASTDMAVGVDWESPRQADAVEILVDGDSACETLLHSLEFAVEVLRAQMLLANGGRSQTVR